MEPTPAPRIRASDVDRSDTTAVLGGAYAAGRLAKDEFDERAAGAAAAKNRDELEALVADLSADTDVAARSPRNPARIDKSIDPALASRSTFAFLGGLARQGRWTLAPQHRVWAVLGGGSIDLRDASYTSDEIVINAFSLMGGCDLVLPPDAHVVVEGLGILGSFADDESGAVPQAERTGPLIRIRGMALMGSVGVRRRALDDEAD